MPEHLRAFIESFILKRYQQNWLNALVKATPADNIVRGMDALWRELDTRYCTILPRGNKAQDIAFLRQKIDSAKLTTCYVLSADKALHQQILMVEEALQAVIGNSSTTIISFVPGKLMYFEGHSVGERYLCVRGK